MVPCKETKTVSRIQRQGFKRTHGKKGMAHFILLLFILSSLQSQTEHQALEYEECSLPHIMFYKFA